MMGWFEFGIMVWWLYIEGIACVIHDLFCSYLIWQTFTQRLPISWPGRAVKLTCWLKPDRVKIGNSTVY